MPKAHGCEFTESTYAFSFVRELIDDAVVPEFSSTTAEGADGGGWDVRIDDRVRPAFYQFKIVRELVDGRAGQYWYYKAPYLRFELRTGFRGKPDQHSLLRDLQTAGVGAVYYAAPRFIEHAELSRAASVGNVIGCSVRLPLSRLGPSDPHTRHFITFRRDGEEVVQWSEPLRIPLPSQTDNEGNPVPVKALGAEVLTVGELIERTEEWAGSTVVLRTDVLDRSSSGRLRAIAETIRVRTGCVLALHRP